MSKARSIITLLGVGLGVLVGCGDPAPAWTPLPEDALTAAQRTQYAQAVAARDALFGRLSGRLMAALSDAGAPGAIAVCRDEAGAITAQVAEASGVAIGRTSFRLRNSRNVPPDWAASFVAERRETTAFVSDTGGRLGVLLPIRLQAPCTSCHGPGEEIASEVRQEIGRLYPDDRATGFAVGELRGWFWVEVAPAQATAK